MTLDVLRLLLFPALMAFAAASDLVSMTISNRVSLLLIVGFFGLAVFGGMPLAAIGMHLGAGLLVLVVTFIFFALGWIGGGDAKVASSAALWFGFSHLLDYLFYASLFGGVLTLAIMEWRRWPLPAAFARQDWLLRLHSSESGIPYGIALAVGALAIYPQTDWVSVVDLSRFASY